MKHVVLFSGGLSSSYVAFMVLQEQKKEDVILLHTPTFSENHDADTFRCRVARYLNHPITEWGDGRNLWELIEDNNCIPGQFIPFCTQQLKQKMKEEFYKHLDSIGEDFIEYVGFGAEEWRRVQKATARNESNGRKIQFPIFDRMIPSSEIERIITEEWKIPIPKAYDDLNHNNCIPCFKAGKDSWRVYWSKYPEQFALAVKYEEQIGHTVFKDKSLKELSMEWESDKQWNACQLSFDDIVPCDCWN
jgi:3'-phosphoadenosine 5'-phosphosulfate sulfotransferase (PAPS reductase)/FAD synthetase